MHRLILAIAIAAAVTVSGAASADLPLEVCDAQIARAHAILAADAIATVKVVSYDENTRHYTPKSDPNNPTSGIPRWSSKWKQVVQIKRTIVGKVGVKTVIEKGGCSGMRHTSRNHCDPPVHTKKGQTYTAYLQYDKKTKTWSQISVKDSDFHCDDDPAVIEQVKKKYPRLHKKLLRSR